MKLSLSDKRYIIGKLKESGYKGSYVDYLSKLEYPEPVNQNYDSKTNNSDIKSKFPNGGVTGGSAASAVRQRMGSTPVAGTPTKMQPNMTNYNVGAAKPLSKPNTYDHITWRASEQYGVPQWTIQSVLDRESTYQADATGTDKKTGTKYYGLGQFDKTALKEYGVKNWKDPYETIPAIAKKLKDNYMYFGDWRDAMAGYQAGMYKFYPGQYKESPKVNASVEHALKFKPKE